jgi:hypothetical protein
MMARANSNPGAFGKRAPIVALLVQLGAVLLAHVLVLPLHALLGYETGAVGTAWLAGFLALSGGVITGLPAWWWPMLLLFAPAAYGVQQLQLPPSYFLLGFALLFLVYGQVHRSRVPLYLSSRAAKDALLTLLPKDRPFTFLDLGAGTGSVVSELAAKRPSGRYHGIESAWLPWLAGHIRLRVNRSHAHMSLGDFWQRDLGGTDVAYAFLSPAPMEALWRKVRAQMKPGSMLISNSFPVPGVRPDQVLELGGHGNRCLYVYTVA